MKNDVPARLSLIIFSLFTISANGEQIEYKFPSAEINQKTLSTRNNSKQLTSGANDKLGPLMQTLMSDPNNIDTAFPEMLVKSKNGSTVQVYVTLKSMDESALSDLQNLGVELEVSNTVLKKVQGWVDLSDIESLIENDNVLSVTQPNYANSRAGSVITQGDRILRSNVTRAQGFAGRGVNVGVISDGSNALTTAQASGNLPAQVTQFGTCTLPTTCNEGTAMAEIVHDIAPEAELAIGAVGTSLEFIDRINQLAASFQADIIVDDLGFPGEPYFQDGDVAQAVAALPNDILYVSAAGNDAQVHYEARYRGVSSVLVSSGTLHDFGSAAGQASQPAIGFTVPPGATTCAVLQWNEPFNNSSSDYDLFIIDELGNPVDSSLAGGPFSIEFACSTNTQSTPIVNFALVNLFSGASRQIKMRFLSTNDIQFPVAAGSIYGHAATPRALAIGTINANEPGNNNIAAFSSQGPARIDFPTRQNRPKPDLIGIDGVTVSGAGGFAPVFFGTSAAAPHIAGVAAQLMGARPGITPDNARTALIAGAIDLGQAGRDNIYGFGRVDAVNAEELLEGGSAIVGPILLLLLDDED